MLGITATLEIMATPEVMGTLGTRGAQAATAPQETMEPQVAPGITETAKAMATRAEWATEVAATRMRDKTILAAAEAHQVKEALRALNNRQAKDPRPAGAIQQVKERPQTRARRRARKQAMVPVSVSQHPL